MKKGNKFVMREFLQNAEAFSEQRSVFLRLSQKIDEAEARGLEPKKIQKLKDQLEIERIRLEILRKEYETGPRPRARKRS